MKNLVLLTETRHGISGGHLVEGEDNFIVSISPNPNVDHDDAEFADPSDVFNYFLSPSGILSGVSSKDSVVWSINLNTHIKEEDDESSPDHKWFHLSHEENSDYLVALSRNGAIVSISPDGCEVEVIGCFDYGLESAAWSADGELLALVTFQETEDENVHMAPVLMTMNTQFEILSEVSLPPHVENEQISVCWNKKTDYQLVAISTVDSEDSIRKIRLFKGESLENIATSRTEDGSGKLIPNIMGQCNISWAGSNTSNLLACVQRKGRKGRNIVFLEQNGLQHGGFKLEHRKDNEEVVNLDWNAESDLLAVTLEVSGENLKYGKVQIYHRNNYHWYLKFELKYDEGNLVSGIRFDDIKGYNVSVALQNTMNSNFREWREYRFIWDTSNVSQRGTAAVVDGNNVNLTMLSKAMIPPPMYASRITFDSNISEISHIPSYLDCKNIDLLVHLNDKTLALCNTSNSKTPTLVTVDLQDVVSKSKNLSETIDASCLRQLIVIDTYSQNDSTILKVLAVTCSKAGICKNAEEVTEFSLRVNDDIKHCHCEVVECTTISLEGKVLRMVNWSDSADSQCETSSKGKGGALIELTDGSLFQYDSSDDFFNSGTILPCEAEPMLLEPCPWISGIYAVENRQLIIGLSSRFRLYFGERQLCDAASSFLLSPTHGFLGYVTLGSRSQLRFLPLKILIEFDPLMGSEDNLDVLSEGYEPRNVERGSTLVAILPEKPTSILQLPRGNLEGVYPRALVLPHIMLLIDNNKFDLALDIMRRQKVDMNLIVDMDPKRCLEDGITTMVAQVKKMDHLNLFLASLQNFDITVWKYRIPRWLTFRDSEEERLESRMAFDFETKVNQVCSKMRESMIQREAEGLAPKGQFLLPILSTFAKESPPNLQSALELIKSDAESVASTNVSKKSKSILLGDHAQSSIKYLAFLADYELLFNTALGMYDFDLAKAVARNSQMDPKVYLPMLKRLRSLPTYEARYQVDVKLQRFESALTHLYKQGEPEFDAQTDAVFDPDHFKKCKEFIKEHKLFKLGLDLFTKYPTWHNEIVLLFGESLLQQGKANLSLAVFLSAKPPCYDGAQRAARACGDYKTFFSCFEADEMKTKDEFFEVAYDVAHEIAEGRGGLLSKRDGYAAGARILVDYLENVDEAVDLLIKGQMWFEGRRVARKSGDCDVEKHIIDSALSYAKQTILDFEEKAENFIEANKRYAEVIIIRRKAKAEETPVDEDQTDETGSLFSLASNASNSSVRSNMSSSSVGSVTSVSSVITAGAASTFSLINNEESIRHKSKFNNIGRKKKAKKKTRRERLGTKPGSEEELMSLITKLKSNIIDRDLSLIISETIRFLYQVGHISKANDLYHGYESFRKLVNTNQTERIGKDTQSQKEEEKKARLEGQFYEKTIHDCEEEVDKLLCVELPELIHTLLEYKLHI